MNRVLQLCFLLLVTSQILANPIDPIRQKYIDHFIQLETNLFHSIEFNKWYAYALWYDFNQDQKEEMLMATWDGVFRDGYAWNYFFIENGQIKNPDWIDEDCEIIYCPPAYLFLVSFSTGQKQLCGRNIGVNFTQQHPKRMGKQTWKKVDCTFTTSSRNYLRTVPIPNGFDSLILRDDFQSLDSTPYYYICGINPTHPEPFDNQAKMLKKNPRILDPIPAPPTLNEVIATHRAHVKQRYNTTNAVEVYAILVNPDNDADTDVHLSSNVEQLDENHWKWQLYLQVTNHFAKAEAPIWMLSDNRFRHGRINPVEIASKKSFYHIFQDMHPPFTILLDAVEGKLHTRFYLELLTEDEKRSRPVRKFVADREEFLIEDDWNSKIEDRLGFSRPPDLIDFFLNQCFARLERLTCQTYPEE